MTATLNPTPHPARPAWETSARAECVRARLSEAEAHLAEAQARLCARPRDNMAVLTEVLASFRASLLAFLHGYGATPDPDATLATLAERAVRSGSVLKTVVHRAMHLDERAQAIEGASRLPVTDREDVETGWYTARDLVQAVRTALPAGLTAQTPPAVSAPHMTERPPASAGGSG